MKSKLHSSFIVLAILALFTLASELSTARAQGATFVYQGQLNNNGSPANGIYDFEFSLSNAPSGGSQVGSTVTELALGVTNGMFTTTIDFGDVFTGNPVWLAISVRSNGTGSYAGLTPLQPLTPVPYAIFANTASNLSGSVASANVSGLYGNAVKLNNGANQFSGTFTGNGTNLTSLNASNLSLGTVPLARLTGITSNQLDPATWQLATNLNGGNARLASNVVNGIALTNAFLTNALITNSVFAGDGGGLTNLNASQLSSGVIPLAQLPGTVVTNLNGGYAALASNVVSGIALTNAFLTNAVITNSAFAGDGGGLTNLNASQLSSGVIPLAQLPGTVVTNLNGGDARLASNVVSGIALTNAFLTNAVITNSVFAGNGGGLTNLNASQLSSIGNTNGGIDNFFLGLSGNPITTGSYNTANGFQALFNNTSGSNNTANGAFALFHNTNGSYNTAEGVSALSTNTSGSSNTASGFQALFNNTSGSNNTANGAFALFHNANGSYNTAEGVSALSTNTNGSNNIALGYQAGIAITGSSNIDIGNPGIEGENSTIRIGTSQTSTYLIGNVYVDGIFISSDRNAKENFSPVDYRAVLAKVASLPVTEWNYKKDSNAVQHIGPMAQDFQAAFGLDGTDGKHISVVDESGVALAAIQGLNRKVDEKEARIQEQATEINNLKHQNDLLAERFNELEATVKQLAARK
jgi:hypothetical protein